MAPKCACVVVHDKGGTSQTPAAKEANALQCEVIVVIQEVGDSILVIFAMTFLVKS